MEKSDFMPSILDQEIASKADDAFGHQDFADALRSLIESERNLPPFSIGLLGSWGTGKSTIKSLYLTDLADDAQTDAQKRRKNQRIKAITFNAWRYGGSSDIKRALLRHVFLELEGNEQTLKDELYNQIRKEFLSPRTLKDIWFEVYEKCLWNLIPAIAFLAILMLTVLVTSCVLGVKDDIAIGLISFAFSIAGVLAVKYLGDKATFSIARYSKATRIEMPKTSSEEYEELLVKQIGLFKRKHKKFERLVIFVDDLDRLSAHEMVDGIDAIRTFMELPEDVLPPDFGIVFVVSCDENRIAEALKGRHRNSDLPGAVITRNDARKYLDRIFQFRLEIPPFPKQDMRNFAHQHLENSAQDVLKEIKDNGGKIADVVDSMIHLDVSSPRNALQIINTFIQAWWLAIKREFEGSGTQRPGGLLEGAITKHPKTLAVLCALKVDFPYFYYDLQEEPDLIRFFTEVFVQNGRKFDTLPPKPTYLLSKYCKDNELLPDHNSLRRYLGSLRGIRWPDSIQPFLQLTQDPITRKYGGRATQIHNALVSGDTTGLLQELGRNKDNEPIKEDDAQLMANIIEDLEGESESKRNNATFVVSSISKRIPEGYQHQLLHPLCRQLELTRDFRSVIGVPAIAALLDKVHQDYQKHIVSLLIKDAFDEKQGFSLFLQTMQPPSLDEAKQMAETIASMALSVWDKHGLPSDSRKALCSWLLTRSIALEKESIILPYNFLEQLMQEYQDILLPELGSKYTDLFIGELENDRTAEIELPAGLQRCDIVFNRLWEAGEDDRPIMWEQLTRMVSVNNGEAIAFAWNYANRHKAGAGGLHISLFAESLSNRLLKDNQDKDEWGIEEWEEGAKILLQIVSTRANDLEEPALKSLTDLATAYSIDEVTVSFSIDILTILEKEHREGAQEVITNMTSNLFTKLPDSGISWLAKNFHDLLNKTERQQVQKALNNLLSQPDVNDIASQKYTCFFGDLIPASYDMNEIQDHIQHAYQMLQNKQNEFDGFVKMVFQAMVTMLKFKVPDSVGGNLQQLFNHAQSQPPWLAWLHKTIAEHWPQKLPGLEMPTIFNNGLSVATNNPAEQDMDGILLSLSELINRKAVPADENVVRLLKLACDLWPYYREESAKVLTSFEEAPELTDIAGLMGSIKPDDEPAFSDLQSTWKHIAMYLSSEQLQQTTSLILANSMIGPEDEPDKALTIWLDSMSVDTCNEVLRVCFKDNEINDDHKDRLWSRAAKNGKKLGKEFFLDTIPALFAYDSIPKTQNTIIESIGEMNAMFENASEKSLLAKSLFDAFLKAPSLEMKRRLSNWLHSIGGEAQLSQLSTGALSAGEDDILILMETFPGRHKELVKYQKMLEQKNESEEE